MAWLLAARLRDLAPGTMREVQAGRRPVLLVRLPDGLSVLDAECTHARCRLAEGALQGSDLLCLCHGSRFDARTGQAVRAPAERALGRFGVEVRGDEVWVDA